MRLRDGLLERVEGFWEGQMIELPDEGDHVAVLGAAEAIEALRGSEWVKTGSGG